MTNMYKKLLHLLIIFALLVQSSGAGYALRPMATVTQKQVAQVELVKEEGRWHQESGKEKWYEIHYNKKVRGWVWFEKEEGVLRVGSISISTAIEGWEDVYRATLLKLYAMVSEEGIHQIHFTKVSNDIFLKYILEYFSVKNMRTKGTEWFVLSTEGKQLELYDFLVASKRGFTIVSYGETERGAYNYFSTGPNFAVTIKDGNFIINPAEFSKVDAPGIVAHYSVVFDAIEKRFRLIRKEGNKVITNLDFQIGVGYLDSTLEVICAIKPLVAELAMQLFGSSSSETIIPSVKSAKLISNPLLDMLVYSNSGTDFKISTFIRQKISKLFIPERVPYKDKILKEVFAINKDELSMLAEKAINRDPFTGKTRPQEIRMTLQDMIAADCQAASDEYCATDLLQYLGGGAGLVLANLKARNDLDRKNAKIKFKDICIVLRELDIIWAKRIQYQINRPARNQSLVAIGSAA